MRIYLFVFGLLFSSSLLAQDAVGRKGVEKAILNEVNTFFRADTTKAFESIAKDQDERGYYKKNDQVVEAIMSFEQLVRLAQKG